MLRLAAWMRPSALLRAAAPPARPHKTRRNHKPLGGSNRAGCMSPAQAATRRSNRDTLGSTKLVKIAARVQQPCGDGPWFRPSSLAAYPLISGRSTATLGVSSPPCTLSGIATDTTGACYARRAGKTDSSLVGASSPRSGWRSILRLAAWMCPSALLRAAPPPTWPHTPAQAPRAAAVATSTKPPSRSRLRPWCRNRRALGQTLEHRVWLLIHPEAGVAQLRLAFRPDRHYVRRSYGYRRSLLREASENS